MYIVKNIYSQKELASFLLFHMRMQGELKTNQSSVSVLRWSEATKIGQSLVMEIQTGFRASL